MYSILRRVLMQTNFTFTLRKSCLNCFLKKLRFNCFYCGLFENFTAWRQWWPLFGTSHILHIPVTAGKQKSQVTFAYGHKKFNWAIKIVQVQTFLSRVTLKFGISTWKYFQDWQGEYTFKVLPFLRLLYIRIPIHIWLLGNVMTLIYWERHQDWIIFKSLNVTTINSDFYVEFISVQLSNI